jgi:cell division inhibitor SepF
MIGVLDRVKGWLFEEEGEEEETFEQAPAPQPLPRKRKSSILSLHNPRGEEIFIRRPHSREEAPLCADCLRARSPVIVNLKNLDEAAARRVFDFLAGVVYAIDGQMEAVGEGIFLLTPKDVDIAAEMDGEAPAERETIEQTFWQQA